MRIGRIIPRTPREIEQFFRDITVKLGGTDTTLADEEQKSALHLLGTVHGLERQVRALERDARQHMLTQAKTEQVVRRLQVQVSQLEARLRDIEGEI